MFVTAEIQISAEHLHFTFVRSSGPGGQNVNKVASKAQLRWNPATCGEIPEEAIKRLAVLYPSFLTKDGEIVIMSQKTRDAIKNKEDCLTKLRNMILASLKKNKRRISSKPTKSSILQRLHNKNRLSQKKRSRKNITDEW